MKTLVIFFFLLINICYSQQYKIAGTVSNAASGEPLPFANVVLRDGKQGATTDVNGYYEFKLNPGNYELLASYIGYKTEVFQIKVESKDIIFNIKLNSTDVILQEVSVYAQSKTESQEVSSISLQSKQMEEITSIFPDVFRSIQSLPGIITNNEFSAKYNVRGGNYDENLVLVNGSQVYEPFHLKEAENASVGIFNMDLMKKVNLVTGGFSAQYGDRLSSVLNIEYREGNKERYTGSATLSMTSLDGTFEGPFLDKGSFILGFRKSYLEYVLNIINFEEPVKPSFYDLQGVITYNFSNTNKLQFKFIHAGDDFELIPGNTYSGPYSFRSNAIGYHNESYPALFVQSESESEKNTASYFSNLFDVQNTYIISHNAFLNTSISYYRQTDKENFYYNDLFFQNMKLDAYPKNDYFYSSYYENIHNNKLTINTWEGKTSLDLKVNPFYDIKTGFSYININYLQDLLETRSRNVKQNTEHYPDTLSTMYYEDGNPLPQYIDASSYKLAGYIENVVQVTDNFLVNAGGRVDYFDINRDLTFSPRLNLSYTVDGGLNIRGAWGYFYQSPIYRQLAYSFASDTNTQSQKSEQYILSLEKNFSFGSSSINSLTLKLEGYYKKYTDLISSERDPSSRIEYSRRNDSKGYAKGLDFFASLKLPGYYGWISYGLLFTKEDLLTDNIGEFPRYTDQRHTVSIVNDFDLGKNWSLNLRFAYGSGFAYTPYYPVYDDKGKRYNWIEGKPNSEYMPAYKRVDLRVNKEFILFGMPTQAFLDVSNLLNFKNLMSYSYRYGNNGYPYREENKLWPIVPSLGVTVRF